MNRQNRIYVDNAATSWPKPPEVLTAITDFYTNIGSAAGRGNSHHSIQAKELVESTRKRLADLISVSDARQISFSSNGTTALNQAILGLLKPGDHVVTTQAEHNSVLRPLRYLERRQIIDVDRIAVDFYGVVSVDAIREAVKENTKLIVVTHASNVTGAIQPIEKISQLAEERGVVFLIDAAQTLGCLPINVSQLGCDMLAASGHKGLLGPLGTGLLFARESIAPMLTPICFGGTGTISESDEHPADFPTKFESGNLNTAAIAGLNAGIEFVCSEEMAQYQRQWHDWSQTILDELSQIEGITCYGPVEPKDRVPVFSFNIDGVDAREAATMLETSYGIETRGGFHCAPLIHGALQTVTYGGTVRISLGRFNNQQQIEVVMNAIKEIAAANIF